MAKSYIVSLGKLWKRLWKTGKGVSKMSKKMRSESRALGISHHPEGCRGVTPAEGAFVRDLDGEDTVREASIPMKDLLGGGGR